MKRYIGLFIISVLVGSLLAIHSPADARVRSIRLDTQVQYIAYTKGNDLNKNGQLEVGNEEKSADVFIQSVNGGNPIRVNNANNAADLSPSWSPDGTKLLWTSNVSGNFDIWQRDFARNTIINLTRTTGAQERWPVFSPDGTKILYSRRTNANLDIWVMNTDGSGQTFVTGSTTSATHEDCCSSWLPDGSGVVYASNRNGNFDIFKYIFATGVTTQLTTAGVYEGTPSVESIGMVVYRNGTSNKLFRLNPNVVNSGVAVGNFNAIRTPEGSPDGSKITYSRVVNGNLDVWIANANGSNPTRITTDTTKAETEPSLQPV